MTTKKAEKEPTTKKPSRKFAGIEVVEREEPIDTGYQVIELYVENIKGIKAVHVKPEGPVVQVTGRNGSGKTSVLDSITWALTGTSEVPSQPIRKGQRVGIIKMDIGEFVVTRHFTAVDPEKSATGAHYTTKVIVEGKDRAKYPSPQLLLNGLMGKISFDPLAFTRMEPAKQLETLRGLMTLDIDIDALDVLQKADYQARREAGRDLDSAKARLVATTPAVTAPISVGALVMNPIHPFEGVPTEPIDVEAITAKLQNAANHNNIVAQSQREKDGFKESADEEREEIGKKEKLIVEAEAYILKLRGEIETCLKTAAEWDKKYEDREVGAAIDTAEVAAELTAANATNKKIAEAEAYRVLEQEIVDVEAAWTAIDERMKARAEERVAAIARADMPIDGLSIGDDEVLYGGLPLNQASGAEQIRVSMALAMASNPKLRVLRIMDGSLLDDEGMKLIFEAAKKNGFQVWIERVDTSGKVGVVMEDGEASGEEVQVRQ
jgi:AAA domain